MAVGSTHPTRWPVTAPLILALFLPVVLPHGHSIIVPDVPCVARAQVHAPHPDPCLEPGATPHSPDSCAACYLQRLLSGGEVAACACSVSYG